jgi:hypothetical protein
VKRILGSKEVVDGDKRKCPASAYKSTMGVKWDILLSKRGRKMTMFSIHYLKQCGLSNMGPSTSCYFFVLFTAEFDFSFAMGQLLLLHWNGDGLGALSLRAVS